MLKSFLTRPFRTFLIVIILLLLYNYLDLLPGTIIYAVSTNLRNGTERNGTPDSAKYLFCGTHQNEPKQLPSFVVIVLNKIEQKFTPEK